MNLFKVIFFNVILLSIIYLSFSFIYNEIDFRIWECHERLLLVIIWATIFVPINAIGVLNF